MQAQGSNAGSNQNIQSNTQQLRLDNFAQGGSVFEGDRDMNVGRQRLLAQDFLNQVRDAEEEQAELVRNAEGEAAQVVQDV